MLQVDCLEKEAGVSGHWLESMVYLGSIMNSSLVKNIPRGEFADVSVLMNNWQTKLEALVSQNRPIKYDHYPLSGIPLDIQRQLDQQGYFEMVLENDRWQHFFVPNSAANVAVSKANN